MTRYLPLLIAVVLGACGGGGSSGGAGGGNNPHAGSYTGTATITLRAPGLAPVTETVPVTIEISGSGAVRVIDEGGLVGAGQLDGNRFSFSNPVSDTQDGITCTGTQSFSGTISDSTIQGQVSGSFTCTGPGGSIQVSMDGTFSASRVRAAAPVVPYGELQRGLMDALHRLLQQ